MAVYRKQLYPAKVQPLADANGYPASGFFAMHITYPDTDYGDDITDWEYGANSSNSWGQGLTVIIRTNTATDPAPSEANNVIVVDLKAASLTMGTEAATRYIAAKINSERVRQVGENSVTRYLRARYVRMSGRPTYTATFHGAGSSTTDATIEFINAFSNGIPSDLPDGGTFTHSSSSYSYTSISPLDYGANYDGASTSPDNLRIRAKMTLSASHSWSDDDTLTIDGEPEKHTIVLTWEATTPNSAGGYWAAANSGPVVQGLGSAIPTWYLTAKPMDGGNMGLPTTAHNSKGSTAVAHSSNHGYVRFSIEGLNSCELPNIPPPDYNVTKPSFRAITQADPSSAGTSVKIRPLEYGTKIPVADEDTIVTKYAYTETKNAAAANMLSDSLDTLENMDNTTAFVNSMNGTIFGGTDNVPRELFSKHTPNTDRIKGLHISNEHMVFDDIEVTDDQGNVLTLNGGSPWGVVIKDFDVENSRTDASSGEDIVGPSSPNGRTPPNLSIQLPDPSEIPGEIFVRSAHDRVQAWSNMTWGMGGLSAPDPRPAGQKESDGDGASQYDTHDRMLVFHCLRLLHPDMASKQGLTPATATGAVPSGSTRLFTAHRISDHTERGSVLTQTANGTESGYPYPHHRIRFARQGHSFVSPSTHRATPHALRRQLHRSHGSSYSLLYEGESEHKHFGFNSGKASNSTTVFELDTLEVKNESGYRATGSFSSEGLPDSEIQGFRLPSQTTTMDVDYLIAPGQEQVSVDGVGHIVRRAAPSADINNNAGATKLTLSAALSSATTCSEFMVNGFIIGDYTMAGGRPFAPIIYEEDGDYFVSGLEEGIIYPRVATELATVPPLLIHDPEYANLAALTANGGGITSSYADFGLLKSSDCSAGGTPDAFLCTWLAEFSHPALFGTSREHFMTFRYREAGMPRAYNYPATRGLLLRNHSGGSSGTPANADAFERIYVAQWLQNYGYNGLNAGGHGSGVGLKSANSVLMGHTTVRECQGTLRLPLAYSTTRHSRGEGIGDGVNPEKDFGGITYDSHSSVAYTRYHAPIDSMVAFDNSRRLPVRAFGFRTSSDALDMLAGDPTENTTAQQPVYGKGRFDGGIHDSMQVLPNATTYGSSWVFPNAYSGVERTLPIGFVSSAHTSEATSFSSNVRRSNIRPALTEQPIGIGNTLKEQSLGLVKPTSLPSGMWNSILDPNAAASAPLTGIPQNKGADPFIDLVQYTGSNTYSQGDSPSAVSSTNFGISGGFHHLRGNALHTNASAIDHSSTANIHYPTTGWGIGTNTSSDIDTLTPIPLSEISDHRNVQSRTEPRLGLVIETENMRANNQDIRYSVIGTKAYSLNSDLGIGQQFPVLPSWMINSRFEEEGMTINPSSTTTVNIANPYAAPTWSPDTNAAKGGSSLSITPEQYAKDAWSVRGSADMPAWGGAYILRKTYLNRSENGSISTEVDGTSGASMISHPRRQNVDYFVRLVRPLKMFGFASQALQDGWLHGPRVKHDSSGFQNRVMTRDNRYGVFEANLDRTLGSLKFISAADGAFTMDYPDSNDYDTVWHLIPPTAMLQFFKSDAARKTKDDSFNPEIEPRYSQTTHPGGGELIHQSESRYANDGTGVGGDFARHTTEDEISRKQGDTIARLYPSFSVKAHKSNNLLLEDASLLPSSGTLFLVGSGKITYTAKSGNRLTVGANSTGKSDLTGYVLRYTDETSPTAFTDIRPLTQPHLIAPTFVDNGLVALKQVSDTWKRYDATNSKVVVTSLSYRGLLEYDPSDFFMLSQRPMMIENGTATARLRPFQKHIASLKHEGQALSTTRFAPYLIDSNGFSLRIAGIESDDLSTILQFRNITADSLSDFGLTPGVALLGQFCSVGVRTSDAAMRLLNEAGGELASLNVTPSESLLGKDREVSATINAHPSLRVISDHSNVYSSRKTKGLNIMEIISNLSQIDGKQLVNEKNGALTYSSDLFSNKGHTLSLGNGITDVEVSKMIDSPNEVIVVGDTIANNESVFVVLKNIERMRSDSGKGANSELVNSLRKEIPGLTTKNEALRLAKSMLHRAENGAPVVTIKNALKSTMVQPGEIVHLNLPMHDLVGEYAVFEAKHDYANARSEFVLAQYEKGIEGLLSDIQSAIGNTSPLEDNAGSVVDVFEVSLAGGINLVGAHKVYIRKVNGRGFIIGKNQNGLGYIGTNDSNVRAKPIGHSKSQFMGVK
jgi:hypothetical protein